MEVESKVLLGSNEHPEVMQRLAELGAEFGPSTRQKDVYYKEPGFRDKVQGVDGYIVRVRFTDLSASLNLKRLTHTEGVWTELETNVTDGGAVEQILQAIGLEHAANITKRRRTANLGEIEILLDEVEELGTFLEVAIEGSDLDVESAQKKIAELLNSLQIDHARVEYRGYPTILLEQQGVVFSLK